MSSITMTRRSFLKLSAAGAMSAAALGFVPLKANQVKAEQADAAFTGSKRSLPVEAAIDLTTGKVTPNPDILMQNSACLGCYASCGNRVKIDKKSGDILRVTGNPYNPMSTEPHLKMDAPLTDAYLAFSQFENRGNDQRGILCQRGNATLSAHKDPNRILVPLKRTGERGSGKWKPITWDELVNETVEGGKLFADIGDDREIEGFRAVHDTVTPLDPENPELGPKSFQVIEMGGRGDGRGAFTSRFMGAYGSINNYGHGYSCGGAFIPTGSLTTSGQLLRPDVMHCEYILFEGQYPGQSGKPQGAMARQVALRTSDGGLKIDVVDPAMLGGNIQPVGSNTRWIPIKPATDAAFQMGLLNYIIANKRYNEEYLSSPTMDAAKKKGFASYCNAAYLVNTKNGKLVTAADLGMDTGDTDPAKVNVVMDKATGRCAAVTACDTGDIEFVGRIQGAEGEMDVKTSFAYLKESVLEKTIAEYAAICEVPEETIIDVATEWTSHGTKVAFTGLGSTAASNGSDQVLGGVALCCMVGCINMKGGLIRRRVSFEHVADGAKDNLSTIEGKPAVSGARLSRTGFAYEKTSEYARRKEKGENPYPATLPWYSFGSASDNQAVFSIVNSYPYAPKIVFNWMANPFFAVPAACREEVMKEFIKPERIPLLISIDAFMGEVAAVSDYIVPDYTQYEAWGFPNMEGNTTDKCSAMRWPVVEPKTMKIDKYRHACYENYLIDVAKKIGLPGFGEKGLSDKEGNWYPVNSGEDVFLRAAVNMAYDTDTPVPEISAEDRAAIDFDSYKARWSHVNLTEEEWNRVAFLLSRGGRFSDYGSGFNEKDEYIHPYTGITNIYLEKLATSYDSYTGKPFCGTLKYHDQTLADGTDLGDKYDLSQFPFRGISYKAKFRSVSMLDNSILRDIAPTNAVEINDEDAAALGLKTGDEVRVTSVTGGEARGVILARKGIAKGTIAVAFGYGHWEYNTRPYTVGSETVEKRADTLVGMNLVAVSLLDPTFGDKLFGLSEMSSGMCARNGGAYRIEKL